MTDVSFPSITLCNEHGLDSGEYVRNVFNNLAFTDDEGNKSVALKKAFESVLNTFTYENTTNSAGQVSEVVRKFMFLWLRYIKLCLLICCTVIYSWFYFVSVAERFDRHS